jgi:hypothetical protein
MNRAKSIRRTAGITLVAAAAVFLAAAVSAFGGQDRDESRFLPKWELGLTLGGAFPMGAFQQNLGTAGVSVDLSMGHRLGRSPFTLGVDVYFMIYGNRTHDEDLGGTIPLTVEVETSNNVIQGLVYLKCQPLRGRIRPYLEALVGGSYLYTDTSISSTNSSDEIASSTNFDDFTFCAGGGAGLDIHLGGGGRTAFGTRKTDVWLDLKVRYLLGGRAQYLREDSIVSDGRTFTYAYRESTTNLLSAQIGVCLTF